MKLPLHEKKNHLMTGGMIGCKKKLHIHCFFHEDIQDIHIFQLWSEKKKFQLSYTCFNKDFQIPNIQNIDLLIITGSPLSVNDEDAILYLRLEKKLIKQAIQLNKSILGICFGAQLIAALFKQSVYQNSEKEFGWFKIKLSEQGRQNKLFDDFPDEFYALLLHNETFDLPLNAIHLASSEACVNQAFSINNKIIGLQFHLDIIKENLEQKEFPAETNRFCQSSEYVLQQNSHFKNANDLMFKLLDNIAETIYKT